LKFPNKFAAHFQIGPTTKTLLTDEYCLAASVYLQAAHYSDLYSFINLFRLGVSSSSSSSSSSFSFSSLPFQG